MINIDKIDMKVEPCPISRLNNFVVVSELGMKAKLKLWQFVTEWYQWKQNYGENEVKKKYREVKT